MQGRLVFSDGLKCGGGDLFIGFTKSFGEDLQLVWE